MKPHRFEQALESFPKLFVIVDDKDFRCSVLRASPARLHGRALATIALDLVHAKLHRLLISGVNPKGMPRARRAIAQ
ncbi:MULTISPECIES: hypothetical protein [unclassified Paraburkholderia]|uniref:hypothetical protein n=1 Tax=unclassified Paraburkholderia TaxID=2615204 RepID=UPI002AB66610|nr:MULTISPECIES: hypothetical protein [unclassified Paraburkholderia]